MVAAAGIVLPVVAVAGVVLLVVGVLLTVPCALFVWAQVAGTYARITDPAGAS